MKNMYICRGIKIVNRKSKVMAKKAEEFFHNKENKWNCCQAILKHFQKEAGLSDEEIEKMYRPCGGGKAEGGLCGALYAGEILTRQYGMPSIKNSFRSVAGGITCKELKGELKFPCVESIRLVEKLMTENFENLKEENVSTIRKEG